MDRADRRTLTQVLLTESGGHVVDYQSPATYDELVLETRPLWRLRRVRVRVADRLVDQNDVDRLARAVGDGADIEGLLFAPVGVADGIDVPPAVMLVGPDEMIARMERSAVIIWSDGRPVPAYDRLAVQQDLDRDAYLLDPVGMRWLPTLALNELPSELHGRNLTPDTTFERMAFRLFTSALRFGGTRHGEGERGKRVPDSVLTWPGVTPLAALLDCKATADGYTMSSDHYLRFVGYVSTLRGEIEAAGDELRYLVILSSSFSGTPGTRHPFHARASALRHDTGLTLVYLRAVDLARTATLVESRGLSPAQREALDWAGAFDNGLVESDHLHAMLA